MTREVDGLINHRSSVCGIPFNLNGFYQLICFFGFLIQLTYVLIRYFSFDYLTTVTFNLPQVSPLPDVVVCSNFIYFVNYSLLFTRYPQIQPDFAYSPPFTATSRLSSVQILHEILKKFSYLEISSIISRSLNISQVAELMVSYDQVFGTLDIVDQFDKQIPDLCKLKTVYLTDRYCFIFACSYRHQVTSSTNDFYKNPVPTELFLVRMRESYIRSVAFLYFGLIHPNTLPAGLTIKWDVQLPLNYPRAFRYQYRIIQVQLLPPPYPSRCRVYGNSSVYVSRIDAINECLISLCNQRLGTVHPMALQMTNWNKPFGFESARLNQGNKTYKKVLNKIVDDCFEKNSQPDCNRFTYILQGRAPVTLTGEYSTLVFDKITEPNIKVVYEPKMDWSDCIVQIGSCLGTWFGFSILIHIPRISRILASLINVCPNTKLDNKNHQKSYDKKFNSVRVNRRSFSNNLNRRASQLVNRSSLLKVKQNW